jgi:hypothetical protein
MKYSEEVKINVNDVMQLGRARYGIEYSRDQIDELVYEEIFPPPDKVEVTMTVNGETSRHTFYTWRKSAVVEYFRETASQLDEYLMPLSKP